MRRQLTLLPHEKGTVMSYAISKEFSFSAGHRLNGLPIDHPCSRAHGHNYVVRLLIESSSLDETGFVIDYRELDWFKRLIDSEYDHRTLNDVVQFNPTAENLARHFHGKLARWLSAHHDSTFEIAVWVSETPKTWATYINEMV